MSDIPKLNTVLSAIWIAKGQTTAARYNQLDITWNTPPIVDSSTWLFKTDAQGAPTINLNSPLPSPAYTGGTSKKYHVSGNQGTCGTKTPGYSRICCCASKSNNIAISKAECAVQASDCGGSYLWYPELFACKPLVAGGCEAGSYLGATGQCKTCLGATWSPAGSTVCKTASDCPKVRTHRRTLSSLAPPLPLHALSQRVSLTRHARTLEPLSPFSTLRGVTGFR